MKPSGRAEKLFAEGNAKFGTGDLAGAADCYRLALELDPYFAQASFNMGCAMDRLQGAAGALPHFERAVRLAPEWSDARGNLAFALARVGRVAEAAQELKTACALSPGNAGLFNNLGLALTALSRGEEARDAFAEAIRLAPLYPDPRNNISILFERFGHAAEAIRCCEEALRLRPGYPEAHLNLGNALKSQGRHREAIEHYREALRLRPDFEEAQSALLFALLYPEWDEEAVFAEHAAYGKRRERSVTGHDNDPSPQRTLNIGYVSADFRDHAVARFIEPVLAHHDRNSFRIFCYSNVSTPDGTSERLAALCHRFTTIAGVPDLAVAELVRRDGIDILVDLSGHSAGNRLPVFAGKPAPVQVTWLGYPFSTGLAAIDYRITDAVCDPEGASERFHSERLLRLADHFSCFQPPAEAPEISSLPLSKNGFVTFGSFNNPAKITPRTVELWSGALRAVPGSRLLVKGYSLACPESQKRLADEFARHGVEPDRLEFTGNTPSYREHLALYGRVDIALDSFPYNGTTTTCEALWMGVPVLTLAGFSHRSRVGASLLSGVGLDWLVAEDAARFAETARALALDRKRLARLRTTLRPTLAAAPLTDGAGFTAKLEQAYRDIWASWCSRHPSRCTEPETLGRSLLEAGRLDEALAAFLAPLRSGSRHTLGGIQETLERLTVADRARLLDHECCAVTRQAEEVAGDTLAETAELLLAAGFVTPAELICRYLGDRGYRSARVSRILGEVALTVGRPQPAVAAFEDALRQGDDSRGTMIKLVKAREGVRVAVLPRRRERFLLIKAWGYGFWSDVNHLLGQCLLAEITGRTPVVQWGGNSLFGDDPRENAFHNFFLPISDLTVWDLVSRGRTFYPPKWNRANLSLDELDKFEGAWSRFSSLYALERNEDVVVGDFHYAVNDLIPWIPPTHPLHGGSPEEVYLHLYRRYLKVRPELAERAEKFHRERLAGRPTLALHVRGGDKGGEDPGLSRLNLLYRPEAERFLADEPDGLIFLLTDDRLILDEYLEACRDRVVCTASTRTADHRGVHYQKQNSRRALGEEVLMDALIAARCDRFVGNGLSNVSLAVAQMRSWEEGALRLFGARLDRLRQITLYRS